ncbi:hypothetical protein [Gordonia caeni]|uniref:Mce-associated membrane protein n=1 Tax=Gordonia caeni TaxID=1007097 RepID=A0ABP7PEC7_9ACTN
MSSDSTGPDDPTETATDKVSSATPDSAAPSGVAAKAAKRASADDGASTTGASKTGSGGREFTITSRGLLRAAAALLVIAGLVAIGLLAWQVIAKSRTLAAFDESKAASSSFVTTYFDSMMAENATPEAIQATIVPLTTGEARERVKTDAETTVKMVQEAKFANMKVDVTAVTVESFTATTATTVVGATLSGTSAAEPAGGQQIVLLQLDLVKEDGTWLVGQMIPQQGTTVSGGQGESPMVPQGGAPAPAAPEPAAPEGAPAG